MPGTIELVTCVQCKEFGYGSCRKRGKPKLVGESSSGIEHKEKVFVFRVFIRYERSTEYLANREMELMGETSLYDFAEFIAHSFGFRFFPQFGFYNNLTNWHSSTEVYTVFSDYCEKLAFSPSDLGVESTYIYNVFHPSKQMLITFDHGEIYEYVVECLNITEAEDGEKYPKITKIEGDPPPQYDWMKQEKD